MKRMLDFLRKNKEGIAYLFFGGCTTLISILSFYLFYAALQMNELIANIGSWILAVLFAFFTNKAFVFSSKVKGRAAVLEFFKFIGGRLTTLGMEELLLLIFITWLSFPALGVKIAAQFLVLISNYLISKIFVFKK